MKKGVLLVVLLFSFSIVAAGVVMHNADNIFLKVNGETQNLTNVVNNWTSNFWSN